jgi:hypothetical protein
MKIEQKTTEETQIKGISLRSSLDEISPIPPSIIKKKISSIDKRISSMYEEKLELEHKITELEQKKADLVNSNIDHRKNPNIDQFLNNFENRHKQQIESHQTNLKRIVEDEYQGLEYYSVRQRLKNVCDKKLPGWWQENISNYRNKCNQKSKRSKNPRNTPKS